MKIRKLLPWQVWLPSKPYKRGTLEGLARKAGTSNCGGFLVSPGVSLSDRFFPCQRTEVLRTRRVFIRTILRSPCYGARQLGKWPLGSQLHTQKEQSSGRCLINITCAAKVTKLIGLMGWQHFYHLFLSIPVPSVNLEFVAGFLGGSIEQL